MISQHLIPPAPLFKALDRIWEQQKFLALNLHGAGEKNRLKKLRKGFPGSRKV